VREPTEQEMVEGIARGVKAFLDEKERAYFHNRRPSVYMPKLFKEAVREWLETTGKILLDESESV